MNEFEYTTLQETSEPSTQNPVCISVLLSRRTSTLSSNSSSGSIKIAVTARIPRKRLYHQDPIEFTLKYFSFLDDRRRFTNLDALLTRLSPAGVVHLSCTESAECSAKSTENKTQQKRGREIARLLAKVENVINSRRDILPANSNDDSILTNLISTLPKEISKIDALSRSMDSTLVALLGGETSPRFLSYKNDTKLMDDVLSKQSLGLLLHMENIASHSDGDGNGKYEISSGDLTSSLTMDRTAMECINLLPSNHMGISSVVGGCQSNNSIFGVLNHCKTRMGLRTLEMWLRQPCVDLKTILYRQDAVHKMVEVDSVGRDRLRDEGLGGLRGMDVDGLGAKLEAYRDGGSCGGTGKALEALYKLHLFGDRQLPALFQALRDLVLGEGSVEGQADQNSDGALYTAMDGLKKVMMGLSQAVKLVEHVLDFDRAPREFLVKPSFNEVLLDVRNELDSIDVELGHLHSEMNEMWSEASGNALGQVRLEGNDSGGSGKETSCTWQFRLLDTNASKILQDELGSEVTVHRLLKNGVYFSTKALRQLGTKKQDLLVEYDKHQREIVVHSMEMAVTYIPLLEKASLIIAELDVLASLAHVAAFSPHGYCKPVMTDSEDDGVGIELQGARHPCVELQENVEFIPNDFNLVYGSSTFWLVTGPNMGGKSTYIRSLGAIIAMAQIGSYVPCTNAKINIVHHILARVGAGDVQDRGISTFMAEMLEANSILRTATKRSLIIVDELGRGTSTFDGFGLATAISEYIVQRIGCMTVFATHFHELTALADREKSVKNCHVTARPANDGSNSLSFLYEVCAGPCLESFGIQVAEMANCPTSVIMNAKRKAKQMENFDYRKKKMATIQSHEQKVEDMKLAENFMSLPLNSYQTTEEKWNAINKLLH